MRLRAAGSAFQALCRVMIVVLAIACLHAPSSSAAIPDSERQALIAIYEATDGGAWAINTNWCTTSPCPIESPTFAPPGSECYMGTPGGGWFGVVCNHDKTHVIGLNLSANNLTGSLPPIAALTAMQDFLVSNNELGGTLPELGALTSLRSFGAAANHIGGSIPSLAGLASLQSFLVGDNELTGSLPSFDGLSALKAFDARENRLTGPLPALAGHGALVNFVVFGNAISGTIPDLSGLDSLIYFYVNRNRLDGSIPPLAALTALRRFFVSDNLLTGTIPELPAGVFQVDFGNNRLTGAVPAAPSSLAANQSRLCPNPLDLTASVNDAGWNDATGHTPWWADPSDGVTCDDLFASGFGWP